MLLSRSRLHLEKDILDGFLSELTSFFFELDSVLQFFLCRLDRSRYCILRLPSRLGIHFR